QAHGIELEVVKLPGAKRGFVLLPRRWVVERSFAWIGRCRRLARDHEATTSSAAAFFTLATAMLLVRRLARPL
ncbi:transposase, partial [Roseomonas sp. ACRSG]|nr:transposase [Roseomonas sp. ACRSG]